MEVSPPEVAIDADFKPYIFGFVKSRVALCKQFHVPSGKLT